MSSHPAPGDRFRYDGYELDPRLAQLTCRYSIAKRHFSEQVTFGPGGDWGSPAVEAAARLVFLLAGVSYYKTSAPPIVDLGDLATTEHERRFLRTFYTEGLGEFAYRNSVDLSGLAVVGADLDRRQPVALAPHPGTPLVPFGGGIDSIVAAEAVRNRHPAAALFVLSRTGDRFEAIERPAAMTGLPVVRAEREVDPSVVRSTELGYLNGHVPVTGILSAIAVMAAVLDDRDAVVMSNEWSASVGNLEVDGRSINHQWSKGFGFELGFKEMLAATFDPAPAYFSLLRPYSELWVAERFAALDRYHPLFRSCNRAFHIDRAKRLDRWCGRCDKCCFIDLVLAPFLAPDELTAIFDGHEPLEDASLEERFRTLLGLGSATKPWECVGEVGECRAALALAAARPDRAASTIVHTLAAEVDGAAAGAPSAAAYLSPRGEDRIPDAYRPDDRLG